MTQVAAHSVRDLSARKAPRFSVVITNYNYAAYLRAAVESVLAQTVSDFELIIVDDGSTDDSRSVIDDLCRSDRRIRACLQANLGQAAGFNRGFAEARGRFICLMDADDLWMPTKLERVERAFAEAPRAGLVQHNMLVLRPGSARHPRYRRTMVSGRIVDRISSAREIDFFVPTSGLALRRSVVAKIAPVPAQLRICADAYVTRTAMAHGRLHSIDVPLGFYRVHGENNWVDNARRRDPKTVVDEIMALVLAYYHAQRVRGVTVPSGSKPARAPSHKSWLMADVAVRRMRALKRRYKRVALYGAGAHTSWLMELLTATRTYPQRMPEIVAVLDHLADSRPNVAGFTIQRPQDVPASAFDAIVLSTSRFQAQMRKRLRKVYKKPITIDLFADLPSTWFLPISPESYLAAKRQGRRRRRASPPSSETRQRRTA